MASDGLHNAGNSAAGLTVTPSVVVLEISSGSEDSIQQVRRRTRCLGPGLESEDLNVDQDKEPESDEWGQSEQLVFHQQVQSQLLPATHGQRELGG